MTREEVKAVVKDIEDAGQAPTVKDLRMQKVIIDILLDIRDVLMPEVAKTEADNNCHLITCSIQEDHPKHYNGKD